MDQDWTQNVVRVWLKIDLDLVQNFRVWFRIWTQNLSSEFELRTWKLELLKPELGSDDSEIRTWSRGSEIRMFVLKVRTSISAVLELINISQSDVLEMENYWKKKNFYYFRIQSQYIILLIYLQKNKKRKKICRSKIIIQVSSHCSCPLLTCSFFRSFSTILFYLANKK